jgi:hypothetical protein
MCNVMSSSIYIYICTGYKSCFVVTKRYLTTNGQPIIDEHFWRPSLSHTFTDSNSWYQPQPTRNKCKRVGHVFFAEQHWRSESYTRRARPTEPGQRPSYHPTSLQLANNPGRGIDTLGPCTVHGRYGPFLPPNGETSSITRQRSWAQMIW